MVSIVMVNYNGHKWFKQFMPYLVSTEYPSFEIIVVDNASRDQSVEFLKKEFKRIRIIELTKNLGFAEGTNIGAREATGEILAFLNNDVEVTDNWLFEAVMKLFSCDDAGAVQCKIMQYKDRDKIEEVGLLVDRFAILRNIGYDEYDSGQYDSIKEIGVATAGAMILWKRIFFEVGCFDPLYFMYYEDIDLSWRIRLAGYKILPCPSSLVYHVGSGTSKKSSRSFITFHLTKNHLCSWLKNSSLKSIALHWPVVIFCILGESLFSVINRQPQVALSHLRAIFWSFGHTRHIIRERKKISAFRRRQGNLDNILFIGGIVKDSSNLSYLIGRALTLMKR